MILIITLLTLLFSIGGGILYIYLMRKNRADIAKESKIAVNDTLAKTNTNTIDNIIKKDEKMLNDLKNIAKSIDVDSKELIQSIKEETKSICAIYPNSENVCAANFQLLNGCCELKDEKAPSAKSQKLKLAKELGTELLVGEASGMIMKRILKKGFKKAGLKAGSKIGAKLGTTIASMGAKMGSKVAASAATKYGAAAAAGPAGWAAGAVMAAFEAVSMFVDIVDVSGYNSFKSNNELKAFKTQLDYAMWKKNKESKLDQPALFPIGEWYPKQFELAQTTMVQKMQSKVDEEMQKDAAIMEIFDKWLEKSIENDDTEYPEELIVFTDSIHEKNHIQRDKLIFEELKSILGEDIENLEFYEFMSTPKRIGISLSLKGSVEWNNKNQKLWMDNNDMFKEMKHLPPDYENPTQASYTDTYYVLDEKNPGTNANPNMISKKLNQKTVLGTLHGPLVSYCEKPRRLGKLSDQINPTAYGVKYDYDSGVCNYTYKYCQRYGMELKNNDCKQLAGQKVAEMIVGKTITGAVVDSWQGRKADFKSGNAGKIAAATAKTIYDPTGLGEATIKRIGKEIKDTRRKKSEPARGKEDCPDGTKDDGTSCWLRSYGRGAGKAMKLKKGKLRCDDGKEKDASLCYDPCKDGYNGVGPMCHPKGGERIVKTLMQRQKCPDGWKNVLGICWEPCPPGYRDDGATCNKN